ncbi:HD domain-containing protein [Guggenheimella bovis]
MDKIEALQERIQSFLGRELSIHTKGVAKFAKILAEQRELDRDLSVASALLHDIARETSFLVTKHGKKGAEMAPPFLEGLFTEDEIHVICRAIRVHPKKKLLHGPYEELLKDADVLQHMEEGILPRKERYRREDLMKRNSK